MRITKWVIFSLMLGLMSSSVAESANFKLKSNIGEYGNVRLRAESQDRAESRVTIFL
jgi:hypothetical protein